MMFCLAETSAGIDTHGPTGLVSIQGAMSYLVVAVTAIGVAAIVWGVCCGVLKWTRMEWANLRGKDAGPLQEKLRHHLGYYLLLGLEFLVAADIIETLMSPTLEHLAILGGLVVIRIMISTSLNWEMSLAKADTSDATS